MAEKRSLLEIAKAGEPRVLGAPLSEEMFELAKAYFRREVTATQVAAALGISTTRQSIGNRMACVIAAAFRHGRLVEKDR